MAFFSGISPTNKRWGILFFCILPYVNSAIFLNNENRNKHNYNQKNNLGYQPLISFNLETILRSSMLAGPANWAVIIVRRNGLLTFPAK
jgi:hypothetical protein